MSKYDGDIKAVAEVAGELDELLSALGRQARPDPARNDAMAHFLSGEEGWREARETLRGTFAGPSGSGAGLTGGSKK